MNIDNEATTHPLATKWRWALREYGYMLAFGRRQLGYVYNITLRKWHRWTP